MRKKTINVSRNARAQRPTKPEFSLTGVLIGAFAGEVIAVGVEVATGHLSKWIMLAGGVTGMVIGLMAEVGRFCWRKHQWRQCLSRRKT